MSSAPHLFSPRLVLICGFTFTAFLSGFMLFPTAPFHILDLGGTQFTAGLFLAFLTYASSLSAPFTGALADRLGKRRVLLVASLTLTALCLLYAASPSYSVLLALVPFHGVFWSGLLSASSAYLVDNVPPARRAEGFAYWGLAVVAAIAVAPPVAFWIYHYGWVPLCLTAAGLNLLMGLIAFRLEESRQRAAGDIRKGFVEWRILGVSFTLFLVTFGYGGITSFVALYAEASGAPSRSLYFTVLAVVILLTRPVLGRVADRIGHKKVLLPALASMAVGLAFLVPGGTLPWLLASAMLFGLGLGSASPVFNAFVMQHVPDARRGAAIGGILALFDAGIGTGSMTLGYVIEATSYATAFALAAGLAALAIPFFLLTEPWLRPEGV